MPDSQAPPPDAPQDGEALLAEAKKAARCLYITCNESVAADIERIIDNLIAALRHAQQEREVARAELDGYVVEVGAAVHGLAPVAGEAVERFRALATQVRRDHARCGLARCTAVRLVHCKCCYDHDTIELQPSEWPCAALRALGLADAPPRDTLPPADATEGA